MNKNMSMGEFIEEFNKIEKYISEVKNARIPKIPLKYLLNRRLIRRYLSDWRGFSREVVNAIRLKILKKTGSAS